ncbi:hypothetical protein DY000_02056162 [Brassica cretica]|uniref:Uncharacterized protein n=1 Tax=Brassica cretica TaxID=69181 RepID=A0ABQ7ALV4_BRACR|nr:hypothetical protein DY000_02056162 [Brassica cretica]
MKKWLVGAVVIVLIALGAWAIVSFTVPPPSKRCGTPGGPPITAPRIRLSNGSYLAYQEHGVSRQNATLKIIFIHAFATFRCNAVVAIRPFDLGTMEQLNKQSKTKRFAILLTHNTPWLLYWWNNQKLFQTSAVMQSSSTIYSPQDVFTAQTRCKGGGLQEPNNATGDT